MATVRSFRLKKKKINKENTKNMFTIAINNPTEQVYNYPGSLWHVVMYE